MTRTTPFRLSVVAALLPALAAFLLFSGALFGVGWYVWVIPQREAARRLDLPRLVA